MTPVQQDLIRVSVKSFAVGFLVGLALVLFALCDWVHAEGPNGTWEYPLGRGELVPGESPSCDKVGDVYLTAEHRMRYCDGEHGWKEVSIAEVNPCLATMETAMRAMEPYVRPELHAEGFYDGCNYCSNGGCTALACPLGGNEVARLEWELKRAKQKEEAEKQRIAALAQWELGKACWRKP